MTQATLTGPGRAPAGPAVEIDPDDIVAVPLRHPWRWILAVFLLIGFVSLGISLWQNENIDHPTITEFIFNPRILSGVVLTIMLALLALASGVTIVQRMAAVRWQAGARA